MSRRVSGSSIGGSGCVGASGDGASANRHDTAGLKLSNVPEQGRRLAGMLGVPRLGEHHVFGGHQLQSAFRGRLVDQCWASVVLGSLADAAVALGDVEMCEELLDELGPLASSCGVNGAVVVFCGCHAHFAGLLAGALGRTEEAVGYLQQAVTVHERLCAGAWEAASREALAATVGRTHGAPGAQHLFWVWFLPVLETDHAQTAQTERPAAFEP